MRVWWVMAMVLTTGCGSKSVCDMGGVAPGALEGTLDEDRWTATDVTWSQSSTGITMQSPDGQGHSFFLSALQTTEGLTIRDAMTERAYPITVSFDTDDDGSTRFTHSTGNTMPGNPGGWLTIDRSGGGVLEACFAFEASDAFDTYELEANVKATMN